MNTFWLIGVKNIIVIYTAPEHDLMLVMTCILHILTSTVLCNQSISMLELFQGQLLIILVLSTIKITIRTKYVSNLRGIRENATYQGSTSSGICLSPVETAICPGVAVGISGIHGALVRGCQCFGC